jgi:5,10-methenyltetrahydrofolate synthetase
VVSSYLAMEGEIDLSGLANLRRCRVLVPRTEPGDGLTLHDLSEATLRRHAFGFLEPSSDGDPFPNEAVDVVLVPGLAFDRSGARIGWGRGMYDRLLASLARGVVRVGVAIDDVVVDELPVQPHDERVHWLATETGVARVGGDLPASTLDVVEAAVARGIAPSMVRFPEGTKTSRDAAAAVGAELGEIAKSLVFLVDDRPVMVICSGDHRVDERKLARALGGESARPAPLDVVREVTGYVAGGTPAVGHASSIDVLADATLARYRWVWSAGGTPDTVYPVSLERLVAASGARWADVSDRGSM